MPDSQHSLATLSFATGSPGKGKISLWTVANSNDSTACNREGRARADELIAYMDANQTPFLLGHVVAALIEGGAYGPLEVGFCQRLAELALAADIPAPAPIPQPRRPHLELVSNR